MIRLLVNNPLGPPLRLGFLGVALLTGGRAWRGSATVVRMFYLFAGFNKFDKGFGHLSAVQLLEVLERRFVVGFDLLLVTNLKWNPVQRGIHRRFFIRTFRKTIDILHIQGRIAHGAFASFDLANWGPAPQVSVVVWQSGCVVKGET